MTSNSIHSQIQESAEWAGGIGWSGVETREWSFLTLGTGADDFWQGYETFSYHSVGV